MGRMGPVSVEGEVPEVFALRMAAVLPVEVRGPVQGSVEGPVGVPVRGPVGGKGVRVYTAAVLLLALLPRLVMLWYVVTHYARGWLFTKGMELGILGRMLALGQPFSSPFGGTTGPTAFLAPGYPFVISVFFRVFGIYTEGSSVAVLFFHVGLSLGTLGLMMHLARRTVGVRAANVAGVFWALSPPLVWMPVIFWDTCASTLLLTGMVGLSLRLSRRPSLLLWGVAGLGYGVAVLINPSLFLALFAVFGWAAWQRRREAGEGLAPLLGLAIMLAVFLPWPVRNYRVMHAFIPFRTNLGYELWNGNQHGGTGRFVETLHPMLSREQYLEYASMGELAYMRDKTVRGEASIRAHKLEFVRKTAWRVPAFWMGLAQGGDENSGLVTLHAVAVSGLGFAGLVLLWRRKRRLAWLFLLPMVVFPLPYYLTHPDFRFRLLLDPLLTLLAAYAVVNGLDGWRRLRGVAAGVPHRWQ